MAESSGSEDDLAEDFGEDGYMEERYGELVNALKNVLPTADYLDDEDVRKQWDNLCGQLTSLFEGLDESYDNAFLYEELKTGQSARPKTGLTKQGRRALYVLLAVIAIPSLWEWHSHSLKQAMVAGRVSLWAELCETHPGTAKRLLAEDRNEADPASLCKSYEQDSGR
jgi:hypothetical protein